MIETDRLLLRRWKKSDLAPFAALNADPRVMEYLPKLLSEAETAAFIARIEEKFDEQGYGLFACERKDTGEMIGYTGLYMATFKAPFTPIMEIGWRLVYNAWGHGFATEAACAVVNKAFRDYGLEELVSFTVRDNLRSRRVMEKLGMTHDERDDFGHPDLPPPNPHHQHVFYRLQP